LVNDFDNVDLLDDYTTIPYVMELTDVELMTQAFHTTAIKKQLSNITITPTTVLFTFYS